MVICICEDRPQEEVAIKLLLLSLVRNCPDTPVILTYPPADAAFTAWIRRLPTVELRTQRIVGSSGWNVKPYALLALLEEGRSEVWWLDSDIVVGSDFISKYRQVPSESLVLCEEAIYGAYADDGLRTRSWGLEVQRTIPYSLNTGVVRVTRHHVPLLNGWKALLETDAYRKAQTKSWRLRPKHMMGDQDVLTALLGSKEFSGVPLHLLMRGRDIIQYFGFSAYTTSERIRNLVSGLPPFIHCQGWKPWTVAANDRREKGLKPALKRLYIEISPYRYFARRYRSDLDDPVGWLENSSLAGKMMALLGLAHPALTGLPLAIFFDLARWSRTAAKRVRTFYKRV